MYRTISILALLGIIAASSPLSAQTGRLTGQWTGTKSERNPFNGQTFTIDFMFEFQSDGSYRQVARLGSLTILKVQGRYSLRTGSKPGNPRYTHILALEPTNLDMEPGRDELRLIQIAGIPGVDRTEQWTFQYDLAPAGALTLQDRAGGETWGLQRSR